MNIFKEEDFIGNFNEATGIGTVMEILSVTQEIQGRLGKQAYLIDAYISMFMEASKYEPISNLEHYGECATSDLWKLCNCVIEKTGSPSKHPLYEKAKEILTSQIDICEYQEEYTPQKILYVALIDDFVTLTIKDFIRDQQFELVKLFETIRMEELYTKISFVTGEAQMESFNRLLIRRLHISPTLPIFIKALNYDLMYTLLTQDDETNKQIFQLARDTLLTNKKDI